MLTRHCLLRLRASVITLSAKQIIVPNLSYSVYGYFRRRLSNLSQKSATNEGSDSDGSKPLCSGFGAEDSILDIEQKTSCPQLSSTNLFIQGLELAVDESILEEMCLRYGETKSLKIAYDKRHSSRGFGFADFKSHDSALRAIEGFRAKGYNVKFAVENSSAYARPRGGSLKELEEKWKLDVASSVQTRSDKLPDSAPTKYVLSMFPYPSGALHMGHIRVYGISDMIARYHALQGNKVIHPMGWDAFGLPAENAAIERSENPETWTLKNISSMREQLNTMAFSFDWKREVNTCDPSYYRWTQFLFLLLYENGLAYRKQDLVNWDPVDRTVLADEQVDDQGRSWRSGAVVEKKPLRQWFLRTSRFAKSLFDGLSDLSEWENVVNIQRNFIGTPNVHKFELKVAPSCRKGASPTASTFDSLEVCVRQDDLSHFQDAQFIAIRSCHPLTNCNTQDSGSQFDRNKATPWVLPGVTAVHPLRPDRFIAIVVTDDDAYEHSRLLSRLGTPKHNAKDKEIVDFLGLTTHEPLDHVSIYELKSMSSVTSASLAGDWPVSRQRFWGTPIPMIHCRGCGAVPLSPEDLPLRLPELSSLDQSQAGLNIRLEDCPDWLNVQCPNCGGPAKRETDTLDTFFDSSWYFLRYLDPHNESVPFDPGHVSGPVDVYIGGDEHACLHMFYARFMCHFLHSIGLLDFKEPFRRLIPQGLIRGETYYNADSGRVLPPKEVKVDEEGELKDAVTGQIVVKKWKKMSKSKHNGVSPDKIVDQFGADITRLILLKSSVPYKHINWNPEMSKMLVSWADMLLRITSKFIKVRSSVNPDDDGPGGQYPNKKTDWWDKELLRLTDGVIQTATWYLSTDYNSPCIISRLQMLTRTLNKSGSSVVSHSEQHEHALLSLIVLLHPMAPHLSAELWAQITKDKKTLKTSKYFPDLPVWQQTWPQMSTRGICGFFISVDHDNCETLQLASEVANNLDLKTAINLANEQLDVKELLGDRTVVDYRFKKIDNVGASINFVLADENEID